MTRSLFVLAALTAWLALPFWSPAEGFATGAAPLPQEKDQDLIQGMWKVVKLEHNGKAINGPFREGIWVFKGKELTLRDEGDKEWFKATFVLDPNQKPKTIDMTWSSGEQKGKTQKGIYKIERDILKLSQGTDERPKGFSDAGNVGKPGLLTFERVKSE
jgi:uncharacterized protein (TIGR03067 family)